MSLADFDPIVPENCQDADFLMLGNLMPLVQQKVIAQLKKTSEVNCTDTMNFWMDTAHDELLKTISQVDVLTINDGEAPQLSSGEYSAGKAAQKIL